jgi:hypothetical protein
MSVYLLKPGKLNPEKMEDDEKTRFSYEVSDGGVLRVLTADVENLKWSVLREYSPQGWAEVSGTRYTGETVALAGFGGKAERKASKLQVY